MEIMCTMIDDCCVNISVGSVYKVVDSLPDRYMIRNDVGSFCAYHSRYFKVMETQLDDTEVKERTGHYTTGEIEPFDVYKSMGMFPESCKTNILKYTMRQGKKIGQEKSDLKKIIDYAVALAVFEGVDPEEIKRLVNNRVDLEVKKNG